MQTLIRRRVRDAAAGLGLHFLHTSEGPFSHDAGHIFILTNAQLMCLAFSHVLFPIYANLEKRQINTL